MAFLKNGTGARALKVRENYNEDIYDEVKRLKWVR